VSHTLVQLVIVLVYWCHRYVSGRIPGSKYTPRNVIDCSLLIYLFLPQIWW